MLHDLALLSPLVLVTGFALFALILGAFAGRNGNSGWIGYLTVFGYLTALGALVWLWGLGQPDSLAGADVMAFQTGFFKNSMVVDEFGLLLCGIILVGAIFSTLSAIDYLPQQKADHPEYYALTAFSVLGMMGMVLAKDLLTLFVALEVMSISVYVLAGFKRQSAYAIESALKYFILGSFASAVLLMGVAYLYGVTGSFSYVTGEGQSSIAEFLWSLQQQPDENQLVLIRLGMVMVLGAFAFKIAAAPFHMWTPDVYEGSPTSTTSLMAVCVKTAGIGALARLVLTCFADDQLRDGVLGWELMLVVLAVVSMVVGNLTALVQKNLKRMLAFSAIAHTGYMLVAIVAQPSSTPSHALGEGLVFYLLAYTLANAAAFGVAACLGGDNKEDVSDAAYAGLAERKPILALVLTISMLSLLGIPATAGFMGKFSIFSDALQSDGGYLWLVILAMINSTISAYYYLRVIVVAYMRDESDDKATIISSRAAGWALGLATLGTLALGLLPSSSLKMSQKAGLSLERSSHRASPMTQATPDDVKPAKVTIKGKKAAKSH
jgi:NADH-quinone oxidoreductase subunit N